MANQVAARLSGDDYQHLFAWQFALELLIPGKMVTRVTVEDALAGSVDDVTVQHEAGTNIPDNFYQIKYHVDQRHVYSTDSFIAAKPNSTSLLEKFWNTWNLLQKKDMHRAVELYLVSNWTWDSNDKLKACFDGHNNSIKEDFLESSTRSDVGSCRVRWQKALEASDENFRDFIRCLRFRLGFDCGQELEERVAERMDNLGLKSDVAALKVATGIVREWIKRGKQELSREDLETVLEEHDLYRPKDCEASITIYLTSIKEQKFDIAPDYVIDWRDYFMGNTSKKGHQLQDPSAWNGLLLPELVALEEKISQETECRLIKARGAARLSPWFAFGFTFSEVAQYEIEVGQISNRWRTDERASANFSLIITSDGGSPNGEIIDGEGTAVAVGISVSGSLDDDVRNHLADRKEKIAALLLLRPERELGRECLQSGGDVVALVDGAKKLLRSFVQQWKATRLLLYYFGPLSGACFLGHRLNAVCQEIQIMEDQQPGYAPSFLLK